MTAQQPHLYEFTREQLALRIAGWDFPTAHVRRIWSYLYRECVRSVEAMSELPARLRAKLAEETQLAALETTRETATDDGQTQKYLLALHDRQQIETVLMRCQGRATACLSSQAGCALGCVFCATGQMGFARNLTTAEIVSQAVHVSRVLRREVNDNTSSRLRNIVLMGMGEPLLNYNAVLTALEILRDPGGLAIANKRITISTIGVIPGIIRLAEEGQPYSLAVSLHAATSDERTALVPATRTWPLADLIEACRYYTTRQGRRIFFEWTLIEGANDTFDQARALVELLRGIPAQINLIPLNSTAAFDSRPTSAMGVKRFQDLLKSHGFPVTLRRRRGIEIAAGCGQLAAAVA